MKRQPICMKMCGGVIAGIMLIGMILWSDPLNQIKIWTVLKAYDNAVTCINQRGMSEEKSGQIVQYIDTYLSEVKDEWNKNREKNEEEARECFSSFAQSSINEVAEQAKESLLYVERESYGDQALKEAEEYYSEEKHLDVMKRLFHVDPAYSRIADVRARYEESRNVLLIETGEPITIGEYRTAINQIEEYLTVVEDEIFKEKKTGWENTLSEYMGVYAILTNATEKFESGAYKESFDILEEALVVYPEHERLTYALYAYQYAYMIEISSQVITYTEEEKYEQAYILVKEALAIYRCREFEELEYQLRMKNDIFFAAQEKIKGIKEYVLKSGKRLVLGEYDREGEDTALSIGGSVAASIFNVDAPLDIRDLSYDITHWGEGEYFAARLAIDAIGLLPVIGAIKYVKHLDTAVDAAKNIDNAKDVIKGIDKAIDVVQSVDKIPGKTEVIADIRKQAEYVFDYATDSARKIDAVDVAQTAGKKFEIIDGIEYERIHTRNGGFEVKDVETEKGVTRVFFKDETIQLPDGRKLVGKFPQFDSVFKTKLPDEMFSAKETAQINECKRILAEQIDSDPVLREKFDDIRIEQIRDQVTPEGYVWHHEAEPGVMSLVDSEIHGKTGHTGGNSLWGPKSLK